MYQVKKYVSQARLPSRMPFTVQSENHNGLLGDFIVIVLHNLWHILQKKNHVHQCQVICSFLFCCCCCRATNIDAVLGLALCCSDVTVG